MTDKSFLLVSQVRRVSATRAAATRQAECKWKVLTGNPLSTVIDVVTLEAVAGLETVSELSKSVKAVTPLP